MFNGGGVPIDHYIIQVEDGTQLETPGPTYGVTAQGSAGDRLEPDYNMENNSLYEMRSLSNDRHSHKT